METGPELRERMLAWDTHAGFLPYEGFDLDVIEEWWVAGASFVSVNVGFDHVTTWADALRNLARVRRWVELRPERFVLARTLDDVSSARALGKTAVGFDLEGAMPLDGRLEMVGLFHALGVRQMLLAYNIDNNLAGGCHGAGQGLTEFGRAVVREMNRVGMTVDCSHMGERATLQMMDVSEQPVVFSHSNPRALCDHGRNITDGQMKACAATGGVIGINGFSLFLGDHDSSSAKLVEHIDYAVQLVGPEHVGLGLDYLPASGGAPATDDIPVNEHPELWPGYDATEIAEESFARPGQLGEIARLLEARGYDETAVRGIMGENFERVARQVWR